MMNADVCFASAEQFGGCVSSCRNAASVLNGGWIAIPRDGTIPGVVFEARLLVLSSWDPRYEAILAERRGPTALRWHSTILQSDLSGEAWKLARVVALLDQGVVSSLAVSDPAFEGVLRRAGVVVLPEVLTDNEYQGVVPVRLIGTNISLFGAAHGRKNILVQSAAFDRARRESGATGWTLHLNGQSLWGNSYAEWLQAARIPYVDHGWCDRSSYLSLVGGMDIGLCATLSESYCYVAADHVSLGVPVVASPAIACLGEVEARVVPDDVGAVARALLQTLEDRDEVVKRQRQSLHEQARLNAERARAALHEILTRAGLAPFDVARLVGNA
jgi:hypothetical protein